MGWDGVERRKEQREYCSAHIQFSNDIAVIKNSLQNIEKTITQGVTFKNGVVITLIAQVVVIISVIVSVANWCGKIEKQVEINTKRLDVIERTLAK